MPPEDQEQEGEFTSPVGPINVDWPRAAGYYAAVGLAVAFDVIAPPLGLFIAAMPLVKLLKREHATVVERFVSAILEGAGKPVGGDAEGVVRPKWLDDKKERQEQTPAPEGLSSGAAKSQTAIARAPEMNES